ncbi:hypothetical protein ACETU7_05740 [Rhodococcus sp. 3Y1]
MVRHGRPHRLGRTSHHGTSNTTHLASAASADDLGWFDAADLEADIAASAPAETPTTNNTASSDDDGWFS